MLPPYEIDKVLGRKLSRAMDAGEALKWTDLE
jgi:sialic acid synthase SpsE